MNRTILLLLGICFLSISLWGQKKNNDFIITMNKDTLYGKVKFNPKTNVVYFYYQGDKVVFNAATIENFGINRRGITRIFKAITNDWKDEVFVEILSEGKINLYRYDTSGNDLYKGDAFYYRYYISNPQKSHLLRVTPRSYKTILKMRIENQPSLLAQQIDYEQFPDIIAAYNGTARY